MCQINGLIRRLFLFTDHPTIRAVAQPLAQKSRLLPEPDTLSETAPKRPSTRGTCDICKPLTGLRATTTSKVHMEKDYVPPGLDEIRPPPTCLVSLTCTDLWGGYGHNSSRSNDPVDKVLPHTPGGRNSSTRANVSAY